MIQAIDDSFRCAIIHESSRRVQSRSVPLYRFGDTRLHRLESSQLTLGAEEHDVPMSLADQETCRMSSDGMVVVVEIGKIDVWVGRAMDDRGQAFSKKPLLDGERCLMKNPDGGRVVTDQFLQDFLRLEFLVLAVSFC